MQCAGVGQAALKVEAIAQQIDMNYELRIVSKGGHRSAVWRYSGEGKQARS